MSFVNRTISAFRQYDWFLLTTVFILMVVSFAAIYSIDLSRGENLVYFPTQMLAFVAGLVLLIVVARVHLTTLMSSAGIIYLLAFGLLLAVLLFGTTIRGTTGWFRIAGFSFQPAEFAKVALVIVMAALVHKQRRRFDKLQFVVSTGLVTAFLAGLILFQPDLGSAMVLGAVWVALIFLSGTKKRYIAVILGSILIAFVAGWFLFFQEYQKDRLRTFVNPGLDPLGSGYNVTQSIIAIGAGQVFGRGLGFGSQSQLHFLPEAQTDFIFSVIAEELGFLGAVGIIILYGMLLWRLFYIARSSQDEFGTYAVLGVAILFLVQIVFNIGAATGLLPVTGLTLPFVSYGGSSLIINFILLGLVMSVVRSRKKDDKAAVLFG